MIEIFLNEEITWIFEETKQSRCDSAIGDIISLDAIMNIGDISDGNFREKRQRVFSLFAVLYENLNDEDFLDFVIEMEDSISKIKHRVENGESVRLWYAFGYSRDICNFYWLISVFNSWNVKIEQIQYIEIPKYRYDMIGALNYDEITKYTSTSLQMNEDYFKYCIDTWNALKSDNSYLRIFTEGNLLGAPEDFHDKFIIEEIQKSDNTFRGTEIINNVMCKGYCKSMDWIMLRMIKLEADGLFKTVSIDEKSEAASRPLKSFYEKIKI